MSIKRVIALGASFVCSVLKTKFQLEMPGCPFCAVSKSRISPTNITFGA